jgi:hypothetical protein
MELNKGLIIMILYLHMMSLCVSGILIIGWVNIE